MLWEMLYCIVFFVLPLVGMFTAVAIRAFKGEAVCDIEEADALEDMKTAVGEVGRVITDCRAHRNYGIDIGESLDQGALVIDFYAYRELGIIRVLKRRMHSRDGPDDTS